MKVDCCLFVNVHLSILLIRAIILIFVGVDILPIEFPELLVSPCFPLKNYLFSRIDRDDTWTQFDKDFGVKTDPWGGYPGGSEGFKKFVSSIF